VLAASKARCKSLPSLDMLKTLFTPQLEPRPSFMIFQIHYVHSDQCSFVGDHGATFWFVAFQQHHTVLTATENGQAACRFPHGASTQQTAYIFCCSGGIGRTRPPDTTVLMSSLVTELEVISAIFMRKASMLCCTTCATNELSGARPELFSSEVTILILELWASLSRIFSRSSSCSCARRGANAEAAAPSASARAFFSHCYL